MHTWRIELDHPDRVPRKGESLSPVTDPLCTATLPRLETKQLKNREAIKMMRQRHISHEKEENKTPEKGNKTKPNKTLRQAIYPVQSSKHLL